MHIFKSTGRASLVCLSAVALAACETQTPPPAFSQEWPTIYTADLDDGFPIRVGFDASRGVGEYSSSSYDKWDIEAWKNNITRIERNATQQGVRGSRWQIGNTANLTVFISSELICYEWKGDPTCGAVITD